MTPQENLHYAIGELAYAIAKVDGLVTKEERKKFEEIVVSGFKRNDYYYNVSDIIFKILDRDDREPETAYSWAMKEIKVNSHYLSPELKNCSIRIMEAIAKAFPPVTKEESELLKRYKKDIEPIKGDPIYYKK